MEEKEINIDDEEQILNECDFDYFYNLEKCSRELCMFYNDIFKQKNNFNTRQAIIDLGRVGITLNQLLKRIKEVEEENQQLKQQLLTFAHRISDQNEEILGLKQQLHELPKKIVEDIEKNFTEYLPLKYKTGAGFYARLNIILQKYGGEDE